MARLELTLFQLSEESTTRTKPSRELWRTQENKAESCPVGGSVSRLTTVGRTRRWSGDSFQRPGIVISTTFLFS